MVDRINNEYFMWLFDLVCNGVYAEQISYIKLLMFLHNTPFRYSILRDANRAADGKDLRYRFAHYSNVDNADRYLDDPCSVLEMMVALAIRCEENIMDEPNVGDRTRQWFWGMVSSLGLGDMTDEYFDKHLVTDTVERFLDRDYEPNGKGGLFTIRNCDCDLRTAEIWHQLCWYLDSIT